MLPLLFLFLIYIKYYILSCLVLCVENMFDKKEKQMIKLVHVIALSALHQANPTHKTETELKKYAFPLELDLK